MNVEEPFALFLSCLSLNITNTRQQAIMQLNLEQWTELLKLAHAHRVAPLLYYRLKQNGLLQSMPTVLQSELRKTFYQNAVRNLQIYHEVGRILQLLQQQQIKVLLLKGVDLTSTAYSYDALRYMADIDLLVREKDLPTVEQLLKQNQYQSSMLTTALPSSSDQHLAPLRHPNGPVNIELHWSIAPPQYVSFNLEDLWQNARPITIVDHKALGLSLTDLLLHICVHTTYQHRFYGTVRTLCDVDAIIRHYQLEISWERCILDAYQRNWQKGLFLCLCLARDWLATPVPDDVLSALRPVDLNDHILMQVHQQILLHNQVRELSGNFLQMLNQRGIRGRLQILRQRIFLPKAKLLQLYPTATTSFGHYFSYFVRSKHLFQQHSDTVWQLLFGGSRTKAIVKQQKDLLTWLSE